MVGQPLGPGSLELASPVGGLFCPWLAELCDLVGATVSRFAGHCWLRWVFRKLAKRNFGAPPAPRRSHRPVLGGGAVAVAVVGSLSLERF